MSGILLTDDDVASVDSVNRVCCSRIGISFLLFPFDIKFEQEMPSLSAAEGFH